MAIANLAYFVIEFFMAHKIGSVLLFASSANFFEDALINFLIVLALGWSARLAKCHHKGSLTRAAYLDAAREIWQVARNEHKGSAEP